MNSTDYPRVTSVLSEAGLVDMSMVDKDILDRACAFGSAAHRCCELNDLMTLDMSTVDKPLLPFLAAWVKFREDYKVSFTKEQIERPLVSERWKFRGTPDRWCLIGKKLTVIDIKSSTAMPPSTAIQMAGYQILVEEKTGKEVKQRWGVKLCEDGTYKIETYTSSHDRSVFLSALTLWYWRHEHNLLDKKQEA